MRILAAQIVAAGMILACCLQQHDLCAGEQTPGGAKVSVPPQLLELVPPELRYERKPLPDEQNAYVVWLRAFEKMAPPGEVGADADLAAAMREMIRSDAPFPSGETGRRLKEWIGKNKDALDLLDGGLKLNRCRFPEVRGPKDRLAYLGLLNSLADMKLSKGKMLAAKGDAEGAAEQFVGLVQLGQVVRSEGVALAFLVGLRIESLGIAGVQWLASEEVSEGALAKLLSGLRAPPQSDPAFGQMLRVELCTYLLPWISQMDDRGIDLFEGLRGEGSHAQAYNDALRRLRQLLEASEKPLDKAETVKMLSGYFVRFLKNSEVPWHERDRQVDQDFQKQLEAIREKLMIVIQTLLRPEAAAADEGVAQAKKEIAKVQNPVGNVIVVLTIPSISMAQEHCVRIRAEREVTRGLLAVCIYLLHKGTLPDSLDALSGEKILDAIPTDPYDGKPMRYSKEKRLLWSVGPNEKDEGGQGEPGSWDMDYALRVPESRKPPNEFGEDGFER